MARDLPYKTYRWLSEATQQWQNNNLISTEQRQLILSNYHEQTKKGLLNSILIMIATVLIGGGVIMLVAHNWTYFDYLQRAVLAVVPVILTQIALFYTTWRFTNSHHLAKECAALFHGLAVGAAMALISQTYHLYGDISAFFLWWGLILLPVVYIARAHSLFMLTLILLTASYVVKFNVFFGSTLTAHLVYAFLLAAFLPYLFFNPHKIAAAAWVIALSVYIFFLIFDYVESSNAVLYIAIYGAVLYLFAHLLNAQPSKSNVDSWLKMFSLPFRWIGGAILFVIMLYYASFYFDHYFGEEMIHFEYDVIALLIFVVYTLCWLSAMLFRHQLNLSLGGLMIAGFPFMLVMSTTLLLDVIGAGSETILLAGGLIQQYALIAYLILMCLLLISDAIPEQRWVKMNIALAFIIYLLLTVFFQNTFDLVYRGVTFIVVGLLMVGFNFYLMRRVKRHA